MPDILPDKKLIQQYLKGDEKSLEILIKRYLKPIYSFVYKNVGNVSAAEDVTQEVFIKVWRNLRKFDRKKNFKPWIFQIAKNASIDFLRKKRTIPFSRFENKNGQNVLSENIAAAPLDLVGKISDKKILTAVIRTLTKKEQKIINLRHNDGLSFKEIAEKFQESINTIKSRHRRALANLRKNINKH